VLVLDGVGWAGGYLYQSYHQFFAAQPVWLLLPSVHQERQTRLLLLASVTMRCTYTLTLLKTNVCVTCWRLGARPTFGDGRKKASGIQRKCMLGWKTDLNLNSR